LSNDHKLLDIKSSRPKSCAQLAALVATTAILSALPAPSSAQDANQKFSINIGPTSVIEGLKNLENNTGISVFFVPEQVRALRTPGVNGRFTVSEALDRLLAGTELSVRTNGAGAYVIVGSGPAKKKHQKAGEEAPLQKAANKHNPLPRAVSQIVQGPQGASLEEIVITGTRILRNGYEAPTPVTVIAVQQFQDAAKQNLADVLNTLPSFQNSVRLASSTTNLSGGLAGASTLNLRGLGAERTLILFDGRRQPPSFPNNVVDTGQFPDALVTRIDVVTGGASAAYGSDAVGGVVNYILDKNFTGVKGTVTGGVTTYGDRYNYKAILAAGFNFAHDRGHVLVSGDFAYSAQLRGYQRDWNTVGYVRIPNPQRTVTNGQPQLVTQYQVGLSDVYGGGQIVAGPLKGIAFGAGGVPFNWDYGDPSYLSSTFQVGGNWREGNMMAISSLSPKNPSQHMFNRVSYDVTDSLQLFAEYQFGQSHTFAFCCYQYYHGNLTVGTDNAFLPESIAARAQALGLTTLQMGKTVRDLPAFGAGFDRMSHVYVTGGKGDFSALERTWSWNAYVQRGLSKIDGNAPQSDINRFAMAIDAVRGPDGQIVCRSSLSNPGDGCVPYNLFGTPIQDRPLPIPGVNTPAVLDYITGGGDPHMSLRMVRDTMSFDVNGEPFASWAGPVSLAMGAEWRKDSIDLISDAGSIARTHYSTNFALPFSATNSVAEGFIETVVPLVKGSAWAQALDFNGAVRLTDYSTSGLVATWKAGVTYNPISDVRLRFTQSRDIRAPNLSELFAATGTTRSTSLDPFMGNASFPRFTIVEGNPKLKPEKADTLGLGIVYQPQWFRGFSASIDYHRIGVKGVIAVIDPQVILKLCYAEQEVYCPLIARNPDGTLYSILQQPMNQNRQLVRGIDIEASYSKRLSDIIPSWNGEFAMRVVATNTIKNATSSNGIVIDRAGDNGGGVPDWGMTVSAQYSNGPFRVSWTGRYVSPGKIDNTYIECTTTCPAVIPAGFTTIDSNRVDADFTHDLAFTYRFHEDGARNVEAFLTINNVLNTTPPFIPQSGNAYNVITNGNLYDAIGRDFKAGIRFRM